VDLARKTKRYHRVFSLAGSALVSLSITNLVCAADVTVPAGGPYPYYFIRVTDDNVTYMDSITRGTNENPDTALLSGAGVPSTASTVWGIWSSGTGLLNTGDINLYISKNRPGISSNYVSVAGISGNYAIDNDGAIIVRATGGAPSFNNDSVDAYAYAYGINGDVETNNGSISAEATGGDATHDANAYAYGINGAVGTNNGSIGTEATGGKATNYANAYAFGIYGDVGTNNGNISVVATGGDATYDANAFAIGIYGLVGTNNGNISVEATGGDATTSAEAHAVAYGMYGNVETNNGNISAKSVGGKVYSGRDNDHIAASASTSGIYGDAGTNNGNISVEAIGGDAYGNHYRAFAWAAADAIGINGDVGTNNGNISAKSTGGNVYAGYDYASAYARVSALGINGDVGMNNGNISVEATGGDASVNNYFTFANATATGIRTDQSTLLINNGEISVKAVAGRISRDGGGTYASDDATAYGISFHGTSGALHSSGLISSQAIRATGYDGGTATAYQVRSDHTLSVTGYAMKFNTQDQVNNDYKNAIFVGSGRDSVFNNATLYAYTDNNFRAKTYDIPTLVEGATVSNQFTTAQLAFTSPDYTIKLIDGAEGDLQQLSIEYAPENSTPLMATQVSQEIAIHASSIVQGSLRTSMLNMMQRSNPQLASYEGIRLASTDPIVNPADINFDIQPAEKGWTFVLPYYSDLSNDASPTGYDASLYGITGGYNHWLSPDLILGFHAGYGHGNVDFTGTGYDQKKEDVDAGSLGAQGLYRLGNNWLLEGVGSFFYTSNDYKDLNPLNRESGDYNSHGIDANIDLHYVYNLDQNNRLLPSLGLRYLWQHIDSFMADNLDNADVHYSDMDENQLYAQVGVDWYGNYQTESDWQIIPNVGIGVVQALTDNEFNNTMTVGSATSALTNETDDTRFKTNASLEINKDSMAFSIGYTGSYSADIADNSVYLHMKYMF
jgi:hypothetical protein